MTSAVFDTNIIIDWLGAVLPAQQELLIWDEVLISRVTWIEVLVGPYPNDESLALELLSSFTLIEMNEYVAAKAILVRQQYRRMKLPDAIIYATAQVHGLTLVTRNTRDFDENMPGVRIPYTV